MRRRSETAFSRPLATTRLYFRVDAIEAELPSRFENVLVCDAKTAKALPGEASSPHAKWPFFLEVNRVSFDEGYKLLNAYVTAMQLSSDVNLEIGGYAIDEGGWCHALEQDVKPITVTWGHYGKSLSIDALQFANRFAPRLSHFSMRQSFNRVSNALRLYESALHLVPSDIALVVFISVLEGLFSTATQELSYRLGLAVSWFLATTAEDRLSVFGEVKELYTIRSKIVHGDRVEADEERTAILLAESYVPRAEELVRRSIRKLLEDGIDSFVETTKQLDAFYQLMALGFPVAEALVRVGATARPQP